MPTRESAKKRTREKRKILDSSMRYADTPAGNERCRTTECLQMNRHSCPSGELTIAIQKPHTPSSSRSRASDRHLQTTSGLGSSSRIPPRGRLTDKAIMRTPLASTTRCAAELAAPGVRARQFLSLRDQGLQLVLWLVVSALSPRA